MLRLLESYLVEGNFQHLYSDTLALLNSDIYFTNHIGLRAISELFLSLESKNYPSKDQRLPKVRVCDLGMQSLTLSLPFLIMSVF